MSNPVKTPQEKEWEIAHALEEFLPVSLEWINIGGYPILYQTGFWGLFKGYVAFLATEIPDSAKVANDLRTTIQNRKFNIHIRHNEWKEAIVEAISRYKAKSGVALGHKLVLK